MLTEKEKKLMARYDKQLAMPVWKFILLYGVLAWGLIVAVLITLMDASWNKNFIPSLLSTKSLMNLILFPFAGIAFGFFMRKAIAKQYQKLKEKDSLLQ